MTPPEGAETLPPRLNNGTVPADVESMTTNRPAAPRVTRAQVANVLATPTALVVLNLITGRTALTRVPDVDVWDDPTRLVLITHQDVVAGASRNAGAADFLGAVTRHLNNDLTDLAARGEIPTADEVEAVLTELERFDTELLHEHLAGGAA